VDEEYTELRRKSCFTDWGQDGKCMHVTCQELYGWKCSAAALSPASVFKADLCLDQKKACRCIS